MSELNKNELFDVIRHGYVWHSKKIKENLDEKLIASSSAFNQEFRYDSEDKYYYIYDNECYLFVFDGKIEVRCDKDNTFSANKTFTYQIKDAQDIVEAYEKFKSITMEEED
jgi:hypothetical protein